MKLLIFLLILTLQTTVAQKRAIEVSYKRNPDKSIDFSYKKTKPGSYSLSIHFTKLENAFYNSSVLHIKSQSGHLFKLRPINKDEHIIFSYKSSYIRGITNPKVDHSFEYILPFSKGQSITINKASNVGEKYFGNKKPKNWESYIVAGKVQDSVFAMRKGIVVNIVNEHVFDTVYNRSFTTKTNSIRIEHKDGTYAIYKNLKKDSFLVKLGQTVYPRTKLGIMEKSIKNKENYRLSFSIYFLSLDKFDNIQKEKRTLTNRKSYHEYIAPHFVTSDGVTTLEHKGKYSVDFDEEVLFKEFTKKEKKKYKKNPSMFF